MFGPDRLPRDGAEAKRQSTAFVQQKDAKNPRISGVFAFSVTPVGPV
jgi:hypothetical protein